MIQHHIKRAKNLVFSGTAKDTYTLFTGNVLSAFLGFLFVFFTARFINKTDAGVFFAVTNLAVMVSSVADVGIASGIVNFISEALASGDRVLAEKYMKAAFMIRLGVVLLLSFVSIAATSFISPRLLASNDPMSGIWVGLIILSLFLWMFLPYILQARKNFLGSVSTDLTFMTTRLCFLFILTILGGASLYKVFGSYLLAGLSAGVLGFILVGTDFFKAKPEIEIYKKLFNFSGWLGINRITSAISGNLDVQMMAAMLGALSTAVYSIPSKLASFIVVLGGSFSAVLATRLAGFGDREKEKSYILKALLVTFPIIAGIIFWVIIAKPFMFILFPKYMDSVPAFRMLAIANIPFILTVPAVSAIIYSIKKPKFIGIVSVVQLASMFLLDLYLIPRYGVLGPGITLAVTNTLLAIYMWVITIKTYWFS